MQIIGNLQLFEGDNTGSVVVQNSKTKDIVTTIQTDSEGWFEFTDLPESVDLKFYGMSGENLTNETAVSTISNDSFNGYIAVLNPSAKNVSGMYLNAASTFIAEHLEADPAMTHEKANETVKSYLYSELFNTMAPGYSADLIAHAAPIAVFDAHDFVQKAKQHGSIISFVKSHISNVLDTNSDNNPFPFSTVKESAFSSKKQAADVEETSSSASSDPSIPNVGTWACSNSTYLNLLTSYSKTNKALVTKMNTITSITDAIAYAAKQSSGNSFTEEEGGISLKKIGEWGAESMTDQVVSLAASYAFSMLGKWLFNTKSSSQKILNQLNQISSQLNSILKNQFEEIKLLHEILNQTEKNAIQTIISGMSDSIAVIQSTTTDIYNYSATKVGISASQLLTKANEITSPTTGVLVALNNIHDAIYGTDAASTPLPKALCTYLTQDQILLSNTNFYLQVQKVFSFYTMIQTQGVMTLVQANNYISNKDLASASVLLNTSSEVKTLFDSWLLKGAGVFNDPPKLEQQNTLYRQTFSPYFRTLQNYISPSLPSDMALGLVPQADNITTSFYNLASNLVIFGFVGHRFSCYSQSLGSGKNDPATVAKANGASDIQDLIGSVWSTMPDWRYPMQNEYNSMLQTMPASYSKICEYLADQGITFSVNSPASILDGLWTRDTIPFNGQELPFGFVDVSSMNGAPIPTGMHLNPDVSNGLYQPIDFSRKRYFDGYGFYFPSATMPCYIGNQQNDLSNGLSYAPASSTPLPTGPNVNYFRGYREQNVLFLNIRGLLVCSGKTPVTKYDPS